MIRYYVNRILVVLVVAVAMLVVVAEAPVALVN